MAGITTRRAAVCGGALVIAIGAGAFVVPAAEALPLDGVLDTVTTTTGSVTSSTQSTVTTVVDPLLPSAQPSTPATVVETVAGGATSGGAAVGGLVDGATGGNLVGGGTGGSGGLVTVTGGAGSSGGGIGVAVGSDGNGGSLASVQLGGSGAAGTVTVGANGSAGLPGTSSVPGTNGSDGKDGTGGTGGISSGAGGTAAELLGLGVRRSLPIVYPAKDGYRDTVSFTLQGLTSSGQPEAVEGVAVLRRGTSVVKRWAVTRSDQVITWNGVVGSKVVPGTYRLTAAARDAAHRAFAAATTVKVSPKRLVATTSKVSGLAISGTHAMAAAPRAGLSRGRVTVRVTTVASKVRGTQRLIFERNGKRISVPVKQGVRTTKPITVPASFGRFTIRHTWKQGQVKLKAIRYVYSYQSLR